MEDLVVTIQGLASHLFYADKEVIARLVMKDKTAFSIVHMGLEVLKTIPKDLTEMALEHEDLHLALYSIGFPAKAPEQSIHFIEVYAMCSDIHGWSLYHLMKYLDRVRYGWFIGSLIYYFKDRQEVKDKLDYIRNGVWKHERERLKK